MHQRVKRIWVSLLILLALLNSDVFSQYIWLNPSPTINNLNKVVYKQFPNNVSIALAIGDYGTIFKSTDDGISWLNIKAPTNSHLRDGYLINGSSYLVIGDEGTIFLTEDDGEHWYPVISNTTKKLSAISFLNQYVGYICGYQTILRTVDSGKTWSVLAEITNTYSGTAINFLTSSIGVTGGNQTYRTTNGGVNWQQISYYMNYDMKFFPNGIGISGGDAGRVFRFTNSGATITTNFLGYSVSLFATGILPNNKVILAGSNGFMVYSTDLGLTWDTVATPPTKTIKGLAFKDSLFGIAVGVHGEVFRSIDGGMNWDRVSSGFNSWLNTVHFADTLTGIVAGLNGKVQTTSDGGRSWMPKESDISNTIYSSVLVNNSTALLSSENGVISKSTDFGNSWGKYYLPDNGNIYALNFRDENNGTGVGHNGVVIKTSNGGTSWNVSNTGVSSHLLSISSINENRLVACGTLGTIVISTDGGLTWSNPYSGTDLNLNGISFFDENIGIIVGPSGLLLRSTNGGFNWSKISSPTNQTLQSVSVIDSNLIVAVGINGTVIKSVDKGKTWTVEFQPSSHWLRSIFSVDKNYFIVGTDGIILKNKRNSKSILKLFIRNSKTDKNINAIEFINEKIAIAVGDNGVIVRTSDGGKDWTIRPTGRNENLLDIKKISDTLIFAVGYNGEFLVSNDLGLSWTSRPSFTTYMLLKMNFYDEKKGVISASSGRTLKTTNGGDSWSVVSGFAENYPGVAWFGYNKICLAGAGGKIKVSTDAGSVWPTTISPYGKDFSDLVFRDSLLGVAVGQSGIIARTINGGNSWSYMNVRTPDLNAVKFLNPDTVVAVGNFGNVIYSTNQGETWTTYETEMMTHFYDVGGKSLTHLYFVGPSGKIISTIDPILLSGDEGSNANLNITGYQLNQNYPNPFNLVTTIKYSIPNNAETRHGVSLRIFDILGREVTTLVNEEKQPGTYEVKFDATRLSSGIYFYRLKAGSFIETKKMILMR